MKTYILLDDTNVAIASTEAAPTANELGLQFGDSIYSGLSLATAVIVELPEAPADFVGGKYMFSGASLAPNPAYVDLSASTPASLAQTKEWPALDFYNKFTPQQRIAIRAAAKADSIADDLVKTLELYIADRRVVRNDGGALSQGLAHLVSSGVMTQTEVDALVN